MNKNEIKGTSVLLLGYGREGQSSYRFLSRHFPALRLGICDRNPVERPDSSTIVHTGLNYLQAVEDYDTIIRSPGLSFRIPELNRAIKTGKHFTSLTNIFMSLAPGTIIGVTGTKGKSTTSSLIAAILSRKFGDVRLVGNIGQPALDHLEGANSNTVFVIECSSFQLEDLRYSPQAAVLLGIYPEHLDYHSSFEAYVAAKANITRHQKTDGFLVFNPEMPLTADVARESVSSKICFSPNRNDWSRCFVADGSIMVRESSGQEKKLFPVADLPVAGPGNLQNVLAAVTVSLVFEVSASDIAAALTVFKPLEHRLEPVGKYHGITFYNDSLSTIPQAAIAAIEAFGAAVQTMIMGGHDRGIDYSSIGPALLSSAVETLILLPDTGNKIWQSVVLASEPGQKLPQRFFVNSMEEAVRIAFMTTLPGRICLMSPAASSLNMFKDYRERGDTFKRLVQELGSSASAVTSKC